jgi:hypothetical protein
MFISSRSSRRFVYLPRARHDEAEGFCQALVMCVKATGMHPLARASVLRVWLRNKTFCAFSCSISNRPLQRLRQTRSSAAGLVGVGACQRPDQPASGCGGMCGPIVVWMLVAWLM